MGTKICLIKKKVCLVLLYITDVGTVMNQKGI